MAITAPTNSLTGQSIAASYDQVLFLDNLAGMVDDTLHVVSAVVGKSALSIDNNKILIKAVNANNAAAFDVQQADATSIFKIAANTPAATLIGTLTVGVDDTGNDVRFYSATTNEGLLYDASEDELGLLLTTKLKFHDIGGGEEIYASANGHLEINAGTTLDITAPTVDINTGTELNIDTVLYDLNASGAITMNGTTIDIDGSGAIQINSSGGAISIGNDDIDQTINIGTQGERSVNVSTGAFASTVTIGNVTGATAVNLNSGTGGITLASTSTGDITLDSADDIEINADGGTVTIKDGSASHFLLDCDATALTIYDDTSASDYCKILVAANGATTISTNDNDGTSGNLTLDVDGDIVLDADGGDINLKDDATQFLSFTSSGNDVLIKTGASAADIKFYDGSTEVCRIDGGEDKLRVGPDGSYYYLPKVDGSANEVLSTNGSGVVSWASQTDTAASATNATNFTCTANNSTNETVYPVFVDGAEGNQGGETDTGLIYNPSSGLMTATGFSGNLTGTLQTAAQTNITSVGTLTSLAVTGALSAGSFDISGFSNSGDITIDSGADVILDADGDDFIFKIGSASPSATSSATGYDNELMRITWGKGTTGQGWNTEFDDISVLRFQHIAKVAKDDGEPSSPVFQFAGLDINNFDAPTAGCLGELSRDGFISYGAPGRSDRNNQCLGNGNIDASVRKSVLINIGTSVTYSGLNSVMIGYGAGYVCTGSFYTTLIGNRAGYSLTTGHGNTIIGHQAGANITTGADNVMIGQYTGTSSSDSSNQIVIGLGTGNGVELTGIDNSVVIGKRGNTTFIYADYTASGTWNHDSDVRMKENIVDNNIGLDFINMLRPVNYTIKSPSEFPKEWKEYDAKDKKKDDKVRYGFIAQEVKEAMDEFGADYFDGWSIRDNDKQGVGFASFVVPLIKAVQELSARVEHLEANNKTVTHIN